MTTPQEVSLSDVRRAVKMFETGQCSGARRYREYVLFIAPDTGNRYEIFGKAADRRLADEYGLNFLGQVPIGMEVREGGDSGVPVVVARSRFATVNGLSAKSPKRSLARSPSRQ